MARSWTLRQVVADRCGKATATALQRLLASKAGVKLSLQSTSLLLKACPGSIRFQTMQAVCNATGLKLSDFCEILPDCSEQQSPPKPLYPNRKPVQRSALQFPSPRNFSAARKSKG